MAIDFMHDRLSNGRQIRARCAVQVVDFLAAEETSMPGKFASRYTSRKAFAAIKYGRMRVNEFRLLAVTNEGRSARDAFEDNKGTSGDVHYSVLLGVNGVGKSRLLGSIARTFVEIERIRGDRRPHLSLQTDSIQHVSYRHNGNTCSLRFGSEKGFGCQINGVSVQPTDLPLPSRVIALTTISLDKFPVPPRFTSRPSEIYRYLGLRDRTGRVSSSSLLMRSLETLVSAAESAKRDKERKDGLADVFAFLGYQPRLKVTFRLRFGFLRDLAKLGGHAIREHLEDNTPTTSLPRWRSSELGRLAKAIERGDITYDDIARALTKLDTNPQARFAMEVVFTGGGPRLRFNSTMNSAHLKLLAGVGLLRLETAELQRLNGLAFDLLHASSGEISLFAQFVGLAASIQPGALVLIDEPETSLHPAWQRRYIKLLQSAFSGYRGCHFIIATHSPLIVSELPEQNTSIIQIGENAFPTDVEATFGQSSDFVLVNAFGVVSQNNYYLKHEVAKALSLAAHSKADSSEYTAIVTHLERISDRIEDGPMRTLITGLSAAREKRGQS